MSLNKTNLVAALKQARQAAIDADPAREYGFVYDDPSTHEKALESHIDFDGGTCNMDSPTMRIPRVKAETIHNLILEADLGSSASSWLGGRCFFVTGCFFGQANRRTTMVKAFYQSLQQSIQDDKEGLGMVKASIYYQMD